jgi:hypothetical protein
MLKKIITVTMLVTILFISCNTNTSAAHERRFWLQEYHQERCPKQYEYTGYQFYEGYLVRGCNRTAQNEAVARYSNPTSVRYSALTFTGGKRHYGNWTSRNGTSVVRVPYVGGTQDAGVAFYY